MCVSESRSLTPESARGTETNQLVLFCYVVVIFFFFCFSLALRNRGMIHLFIHAYAERPTRVVTSPLPRERRGRIASGMGGPGVTGFRGVLSGTGRGTTFTDAKSAFLLCGPSDRRAGLVALSSFLFRTSVPPKGVSTSRRTGPYTAIKMRLFLGHSSHFVSFRLIRL